MNPSDQQLLFFSTLLQLEAQARNAKDKTELNFIIANETVRLVKYRQAIVWQPGLRGTPVIKTVSGVDVPDKNAPYITCCSKILSKIHKHPAPRSFSHTDMPAKLEKDWLDWGLGHVLHCPLTAPNGHELGGVIFIRDIEWQDAEISLISRLMEAYSHSLSALYGKKISKSKFLSNLPKRVVQLTLLIAVIMLMDLPVRLSVLAPVEIVPFEPLLVTSPLGSVVEKIFVEPNQEVDKGTLILSLDNTATKNQYLVAEKALEVMNTEFIREKQKSFIDPQSRAVLLNIQAAIDQKKAEISYIKDLLNRSEIKANQGGIVLFSDVHDWLGKPVAVGEKIMTIADPQKVEAQIMLPVNDAINLNSGAEVLIFLNIKPDQPLKAHLRQASFEASVSSEGILSFRLKARLAEQNNLPRIGLQGTAKIYGEQVSLFYYLMRKPLITLRQTIGV